MNIIMFHVGDNYVHWWTSIMYFDDMMYNEPCIAWHVLCLRCSKPNTDGYTATSWSKKDEDKNVSGISNC